MYVLLFVCFQCAIIPSTSYHLWILTVTKILAITFFTELLSMDALLDCQDFLLEHCAFCMSVAKYVCQT